MRILQEELVIGEVFDVTEPSRSSPPRQANTVYRLTGMVCYYGLHYVGTRPSEAMRRGGRARESGRSEERGRDGTGCLRGARVG